MNRQEWIEKNFSKEIGEKMRYGCDSCLKWFDKYSEFLLHVTKCMSP